jgi:hypothetical protein
MTLVNWVKGVSEILELLSGEWKLSSVMIPVNWVNSVSEILEVHSDEWKLSL